MTRTGLPTGYHGFDVRRNLESILAYDQFDDWVSDPVYYQDVGAAQHDYVDSILRIIGTRTLAGEEAYSLDIQSNLDRKFHAVSVPLPLRVITADIIASQAERLQRHLQADRVYGFKYQARDD